MPIREQKSGFVQKNQYARHLPPRAQTQQQIIAAARRQAADEAAGEGDYNIEEDEAYYQTRLPTSARRYQVSPEQIYQSGNTRFTSGMWMYQNAKADNNSHHHSSRSDIPMKWKQSPKPIDTYIHCCI